MLKGESSDVDFRFLLPTTEGLSITNPRKATDLITQGYLPPQSLYDFVYGEKAYENSDFEKKLDRKFGQGKWETVEYSYGGPMGHGSHKTGAIVLIRS